MYVSGRGLYGPGTFLGDWSRADFHFLLNVSILPGMLSGPQHQADSSFVFVFDGSRALLIWGESGHQFYTDSLFYFWSSLLGFTYMVISGDWLQALWCTLCSGSWTRICPFVTINCPTIKKEEPDSYGEGRWKPELAGLPETQEIGPMPGHAWAWY